MRNGPQPTGKGGGEECPTRWSLLPSRPRPELTEVGGPTTLQGASQLHGPILAHSLGPGHDGRPSPTPVASLQSRSCAAASGDTALIPHIMARAGHNEAGVMGEEEAVLRRLHFLELMTSLHAAGTIPLTPSGSSGALHSPAGTGAEGLVGGRQPLGRAAGGAGGGNKGYPLMVARTPLLLSLLLPSLLSFLFL